MRNYLYISFGSQLIHRQNLHSILSLIYHESCPTDYKIFIFTDNKSFYRHYIKKTNIIYLDLTQRIINEFRGKYDYLFRIKIMSILHVLEISKGKLLYLDGDTFFKKSPLPIFNSISKNNTFMYQKEGKLGNELIKNWQCIREFIPNYQFEDLNKNIFQIKSSDFMWNAGIIAISFEDKELVSEVLNATDQYCSFVGENKYHQDQLMFSYFFQNRSNLQESKEYIHHYCYFNEKDNMNIILKKFYTNKKSKIPFTDLLNEVYSLTQKDIPNDVIPPNIFKQVLNFMTRIKTSFRLRFNRLKNDKKLFSFFENL